MIGAQAEREPVAVAEPSQIRCAVGAAVVSKPERGEHGHRGAEPARVQCAHVDHRGVDTQARRVGAGQRQRDEPTERVPFGQCPAAAHAERRHRHEGAVRPGGIGGVAIDTRFPVEGEAHDGMRRVGECERAGGALMSARPRARRFAHAVTHACSEHHTPGRRSRLHRPHARKARRYVTERAPRRLVGAATARPQDGEQRQATAANAGLRRQSIRNLRWTIHAKAEGRLALL